MVTLSELKLCAVSEGNKIDEKMLAAIAEFRGQHVKITGTSIKQAVELAQRAAARHSRFNQIKAEQTQTLELEGYNLALNFGFAFVDLAYGERSSRDDAIELSSFAAFDNGFLKDSLIRIIKQGYLSETERLKLAKAVVGKLDQGNPEAKISAAIIFGHLAVGDSEIVSALSKALDDKGYRELRFESALALGKLGKSAEAVIPKLRMVVEDDISPAVRSAASSAIKRIKAEK